MDTATNDKYIINVTVFEISRARAIERFESIVSKLKVDGYAAQNKIWSNSDGQGADLGGYEVQVKMPPESPLDDTEIRRLRKLLRLNPKLRE